MIFYFFPIVVLIYYVIPKRFGRIWLLAASYYFYNKILKEQWEEYVIYKISPVTYASEETIDVNVGVEKDGLTEENETPTVIRNGKDTCVVFRSDDYGVIYAEMKLEDSTGEANWVKIEF